MNTNSVSSSHSTAEYIVGSALSAFEQGAGDLRMSPPAVEAFRIQFIRAICEAFDRPNRQNEQRHETAQLLAYADAMGLWAAALATEEGRRVITRQDIHSAAIILRGYMAMISRWCPLKGQASLRASGRQARRQRDRRR